MKMTTVTHCAGTPLRKLQQKSWKVTPEEESLETTGDLGKQT